MKTALSGTSWTEREATCPPYLHQAFPPLFTRLLAARTIDGTSALGFLQSNYSRDRHNPLLFRDMEKVIARVARARENHEAIAIYGDYDADGICGAAILHEGLALLNLPSTVFLPDRNTHGYGLNIETIEIMLSQNISLLFTCDCGISNITEIAFAQERGIDVIITDHHQFSEIFPPAFAIIHPLLPHEAYPGKTLSGGGVALKCVEGIIAALAPDKITEIPHLYDLAAIASVADMVPLTLETRALTRAGILCLQENKRPGIQAILRASNIEPSSITTETIGFSIAPRINAPGRLASPRIAFDLLTAKTSESADQAFFAVNELNTLRQDITAKAIVEARKQVERELQQGHNIVFAYSPLWPVGIVGLIANKLKDEYGTAALVMAPRGTTIVGSGRAPKGMNITHALVQVQEYLHAYGGHPQACGFTLKSADCLPYFEDALREILATSPTTLPSFIFDTTADFSELSHNLADLIGLLAPFGIGNEQPRVISRSVTITDIKTIGTKGSTISLTARQSGVEKRFIGFKKASWIPKLHIGDTVDLAYTLGKNEWRGRTELQLALDDIR